MNNRQMLIQSIPILAAIGLGLSGMARVSLSFADAAPNSGVTASKIGSAANTTGLANSAASSQPPSQAAGAVQLMPQDTAKIPGDKEAKAASPMQCICLPLEAKELKEMLPLLRSQLEKNKKDEAEKRKKEKGESSSYNF